MQTIKLWKILSWESQLISWTHSTIVITSRYNYINEETLNNCLRITLSITQPQIWLHHLNRFFFSHFSNLNIKYPYNYTSELWAEFQHSLKYIFHFSAWINSKTYKEFVEFSNASCWMRNICICSKNYTVSFKNVQFTMYCYYLSNTILLVIKTGS